MQIGDLAFPAAEALAAPERTTGSSALARLKSRLAQVKKVTAAEDIGDSDSNNDSTAGVCADTSTKASSETPAAAPTTSSCVAPQPSLVSEHSPVYSEMQLKLKLDKLQVCQAPRTFLTFEFYRSLIGRPSIRVSSSNRSTSWKRTSKTS